METKAKILLTLFITYAYFTGAYLTTNDASRFSLTSAIVEDQTFEIENFLDNVITEWWWAKDFVTYNGHLYSDKAPLGSFLGVPIYFLIRLFTNDLGTLIYFVTLFTSGLLTTATALLIFEMGKYFEAESEVKITLAMTYGLGTMAFFYGTVLFSHAITAFFSFLAFYLLFDAKRKSENLGKKMALSGFFAGLGITSDYYAGIIAIALFIYAVQVDSKKTYLYLFSLLIAVFVLLLYNWSIFEDPFIITYLYSNLYGKFHSIGFYGVRFPDSVFRSNLFSMLFSPWGFFFTTPLAAISFLSLPKFWKNNRAETLTILIITIGLFFVLGSIGRFDAYSSRLLTPLVPFLFIPLYSLDYGNWKIRSIFAFLILFSFVTNLVGVDSFLPEIADIEVIRSTYGNHNIFGEFLLNRGVNLHWFTLIPLFIAVFLIWRKAVLNKIKMKLSTPRI
jgi:hypothetical protein